MNFFKKLAGAMKDLAFQFFGVEAVFGPGTGPEKKSQIMEFLKKAIGFGEAVTGNEIVDQDEFVAGLDQAAEGVLRALKATRLWQVKFPRKTA